jgi:hypothetical protein
MLNWFGVFALELGALLALMALISAWLFRTTGAPLWLKVIVPTLCVLLAISAPWQVNRMLGLPVSANIRDLPDNAELVAFVPHDEAKRVDIWLIEKSGGIPRAFEVELTAQMKKSLREAQSVMGQGGIAMMRREASAETQAKTAGDMLGIGNDDMAYVLSQDAITQLPPK